MVSIDTTENDVNELVRIERIEGEDGNYYYAEFDKDGNLVTEATLMEE